MLDFEVVMIIFLYLIGLELEISWVLIMIDFLKWEIIELGFKCI